jgi:lipopolysaccharide export system protein LptC
MYGRPTILFPLALLALLALLTLWIERSVHAPQHKLEGNTRHDPDYMVNNFVTTKTDLMGNLHYVLAAVGMKHYPDDDSTELVRPRFTQYDIGKPYTQIEGQRGLVSSNGENVQFMDNVKVVRQAFKDRGEMTVLTEYLNVTPKSDIATTDKPVVIMQAPKTVVHAIGMIYDKKQRTVQLLNKVRVHYERPETPDPLPANKAKSLNETPGAITTNKSAGAAKAQQSTASAHAAAKTTPNQNNTRIRRPQ